MARWAPGAKERLEAAAFEAIRDRGLETVTVAEIAAAAGVTERTFFRYFADKREVLFSGQNVLVDTFVAGIRDAPAQSDPWEVVVRASRVAAASIFPDERRRSARVRGAVIAGDPALVERESLKMRALTEAIAAALRERGAGEPTSSLLAETYIGLFNVAFRQWLVEGEERSLDAIQDALLARLSALLPQNG